MLVTTANRIQVLVVVSALFATTGFPELAKGVDLYTQNFESVTLGPIVSYSVLQRDREAWSATPPVGMTIDNSGMPPAVMADPNNGVTEFEGWTIVDKSWWMSAAGDQGRTGFFNGLGKIAVADNDTHDDLGDPDAVGPYDSKLSTPSINLLGAAANTVNLRFSSSWVPEEIQKATVTARYNTGANIEVLRWTSPANDPNFHASAVNELVTIPLQNPVGATSVTLDFRLFDATNNWWWGIDNINVFTGAGVGTDGVLRAIIDRTTSNVTIVNNTGATVSMRGYSLTSGAGAFNEPNAAFLADGDPNWVQLTAPNATSNLSEGHLSSSNLANAGTINLGNNVWRKYYQDSSDIGFQYLVAGNDDPISGIVEFTGNGGASFPFIDLNFNNSIDPGDWDVFRAGFPVSLAGKSTVERYQLGDLDNDGLHTPSDFLRFRNEYDSAVGAGGFAAMLASSTVPEPSSGFILLSAALAGGIWMRQQRARLGKVLSAAASVVVLCLSATNAQAQLTLFSANFDTQEAVTLGPSVEEANAGTNVWTDTPPAGWSKDDSGVPGVNNPPLPLPNNNGMFEWAGWAFTDKTWWSTQVDGQGRQNFNRGSGAVMVADPDEWDDQVHPDVNEANGDTSACAGDTVNPCMYDAFITTRPISIPAGIPADKIRVAFDSSWDHEGADDSVHLANNQRATVVVAYNDRAPFNVMTWDSVPDTSPNFHDTAYDEAVVISDQTMDYNGTSTSMTLTFGLDLAENDWWWAVDNIRVFVPAEPSKLRIDTNTGWASIVGGDVISTPINMIDIGSNNSVLNGAALSGLSVRKPDSVDGEDPGSTVGDSSGEFWQQLSAADSRIAEAFLLGSSTFNNTRTEYLGTIFDTTTLVGQRDVTFSYTTTFGDIVNGIVEYCTGCSPAGVTGDYNADGKVDAADWVRYRKFLGQSHTMPNDSTPGTVAAADRTAWRQNYGMSSSGSGGSAPVPEPCSGLLAAWMLMVGALMAPRRRACGSLWSLGMRLQPVPARVSAMFAACVCAIGWFAASASAVPPTPYLDRNYRMGDDPLEDVDLVTGGIQAVTNGATVARTRDQAGTAGLGQQLIHLDPVNGPKYEALPTVGGGPVPVRPDGGTGFAIRLNPTAASQGQHLKTAFEFALNFPERSPSSFLTAGGSIDYTFVRDRGFQLWVLPQTAARADIVSDTLQHGAFINSSGRFAMRYGVPSPIPAGKTQADYEYDTGVAVVPNTWYHLMVVRPFGSGLGSIMYVNGVAKAQASGTYRGDDFAANEDTTPLVVGANTGTGISVGLQNRFQGMVDDLEMFVMGLNGPSGAITDINDFGEFIFERDNKYGAFFKPSNAVDLTNDNIVNMADVDIFVDNWLYRKVVGTQVVGDLETRMKGDFNFDGYVNLIDWEMLNELAPPGTGAAAWNMIQGIPEPGSACLAGLAILAGLGFRRAGRRT